MFSLKKFSKWKEKSQSNKRRVPGLNREQRRYEHSRKRKRRR